MELEFELDSLRYYDRLAETTLCQEETLESIVPDACPDILRIVDVWGESELGDRQAREDCAVVSGTVRAVILYQPEEGELLRRMEVSLPFTCQLEAKGLTERGIIQASPRLRSAEARALNPRKVLLRVDLAVGIRVFQPVEQYISSGAIADAAYGICQRQIQEESDVVISVDEKPFTFSDSVKIGNGQNGLLQVLAVRAQPVCSESKRIGNKLIFKGNVELSVLFLEGQGILSSSRESLPFSQVIELSESGDNIDSEIEVELTHVNWQMSEAEEGFIEISLDLLAQVQLYSRRTITLLHDLYSTAHQMQTDVREQLVWKLVDQTVRPQAVRELLETNELVRSVLDSKLTLGSLSQIRDGNQLCLQVEAWVSVLYLDDKQQLQVVKNMIPVSSKFECPEQVQCSCICSSPGEVFALPGAGGIELRFGVEFHCRARLPKLIACVENAQLGTMRCGEEGRIPSVVLRLAAPGEEIWDIAKAYGTTQEQIMQANELNNGTLPAGKMLLIPKVR